MPKETALFSRLPISWRQILPTFLLLAISLIICLGSLIFIHTREAIRHNTALILHEQQTHMELASSLLHEELERRARELLVFAHSPGIRQFLAHPDDQAARQRVQEGLSNFIFNKDGDEQILILDTNGKELVRLEPQGEQTAIPHREPETTSWNTLIREALQLQIRDQVVFLPMEPAHDDRGERRQFFQPLLRLATPVFDQHNRRTGTLLRIYQEQPFFDLFTKTMGHSHDLSEQSTNYPQILNQEGYWLLTTDKQDEWGAADDQQRRFDHRFPELWQTMLAQGQGQIRTREGVSTFAAIPLILDSGSQDNDHTDPTTLNKDPQEKLPPFWLLLNQVPQTELDRLNTRLRHFHLILFLVAIAGSLPLLLWITLLRRKEQEIKKQLRAQEQQFRLLYDKAPLPYQSLDQEGHLRNINQAWLTAIGYSREEVLGHWFGDFLTPKSLEPFHKSFAILNSENHAPQNCELELLKKDGSILLGSFHAQWSSTPQEDIASIHCIFTDITALRVEQQRTAHLQLLLQTIILIHRLMDQETERQKLVQRCCEILVTNRGYASAWIFLLNPDGKIEVSAESGLLHNIDQMKQQINLNNPPACIRACKAHHDMVIIDAPALFCHECPMTNGYPLTGLMCAPLQHDLIVYGYLNVSLPIDFTHAQEEKDRFREIAEDIGYALFNLDQQQQKLQTETALRHSEQRLRGITDSALDAILMVDSSGAISYWNPAAERILGYDAEEALGHDLHTLLCPQRFQADFHVAFADFVRTGRGKIIGKTVELSALRKDGREIPITLSLSSFLQDEEWNAVGILRDISDRKKMEEQMLQSEKMTTIAGLAAGVAHEINTPLSAILQSIQVIRQSLSPDFAKNRDIADQCGLDLLKVQDYFQKRELSFFMDGIRDSAIKSGKIISSLLQFSRPQKMEFVAEDITVLLDRSLELMQSDYDLKKKFNLLKVEIIREYSPHLPQISCMPTDIEQVFINILKNTLQALEKQPKPRSQPRIILRALQHGEVIRIEIEDNGIGMDEKTKLHIFDPFFTTNDIGEGTGLGLYVSYTIIVSKHQGRLTVDSTPGQGTTFTIDLPVTQERP